ncbi:DUF4158 domain-containing protein [Streptomyces sp. PvR018]|uniref:DUF4158 domain-containing protein n=1 Tax=Streptomyces TaxID=1883 RepID=UPI000B91770F|nr:hypothetical protein BEH93_35295 [Streptomyces sp. 2R]
MRQDWEPEDLIEVWTLPEEDQERLRNKSGANRLGFALLLKFFEVEARFPEDVGEIPVPAVSYVAQQVKVPAEEWTGYDWSGRGRRCPTAAGPSPRAATAQIFRSSRRGPVRSCELRVVGGPGADRRRTVGWPTSHESRGGAVEIPARGREPGRDRLRKVRHGGAPMGGRRLGASSAGGVVGRGRPPLEVGQR